MALKISTKPPVDPNALHLRATPKERKHCTGYRGDRFGPLCLTEDVADVQSNTTFLSKNVTCPHCLKLMPRADEVVRSYAPPRVPVSAPVAPVRVAPTPPPARVSAPAPKTPYDEF